MVERILDAGALRALMPCLMTGATGQIGSVVLARLNEAGVTPSVVLRRPMPEGAWRGARVEEIPADLEALAAGTVPPALREALGRARTVLHLAARVNLAGRGAEQMSALNDRAAPALFDLARECGVRRFVHVSTAGTIGFSRQPRPMDEDAEWNAAPIHNPYLDTKRRAEEQILARWAADPAPTDLVIANPTIVVGRPSSLRRLARGRRRPPPRPGAWPLPLVCFWFEGGLNAVDLRDAADGILRVAAFGEAGRRYILGGDNLTIRQLMEEAHRALGTGRPVVRIPTALARASAAAAEGVARLTRRRARWNRSLARLLKTYWFVDSGRAERELGWRHRPFAETLADLREWMLASGVE